MDLLESLTEEAARLRRHFWAASQTWGAKLDHVFATLIEGNENLSGVGHSYAVMFLLAGVHGMPPIEGKDSKQWAEEWKAANPGPWKQQFDKLSRVVPRSYGSELAATFWRFAVQLTKNRETAEDTMQTVLLNFLSGAGESIKSMSYDSATKYVKNSIKNNALNVMKRQQKNKSMTHGPGEDEGLEMDIADSHSLDDLEDDGATAKALYDTVFHDPKLKGELEHVHPDAIQYLHLLATTGYNDTDILGVRSKREGGKIVDEVIGPPMLAHPMTSTGKRMYPRAWAGIKEKMFAVIRNHFHPGGEHDHEHHASYSYDRRPGAVYATTHDRRAPEEQDSLWSLRGSSSHAA